MLEPNLIARFTTHLKEALQKALTFAVRQGRDLVEPGDLVVGLLQEPGSIGADILGKSQVSLSAAEEAFRGTAHAHPSGTPIAPDLSPIVKKLLEKCVLTAHIYEHRYVGTEHLLFALLETSLPDIQTFFETQGVSIESAKEQVLHVLKSTSKFPHLAPTEEEESETLEAPAQDIPQARPRPGQERRPKALEVFARDLTAPDVVTQLDPVIGREQEIERLIQVLCRRTKNNPLLLGDPGVGKTALVEGLAQRLASGQVPDILQGKRLLAVDLTLLVAGTMYRGEFEARLKQLVEEVKADKNIILFIDEIHNIVGAGSTSGSLDAANILKPALARGEIRCIGATTWAEYKKFIEPDAALERRYQPVEVHEPSAELTRQMLHGLKNRYEEHHNVRFAADTLDAAVSFAERYLTDRFFPDKAIDLMDESAALVTAQMHSSNESLERVRALEIAIQAAKESKERLVAEQKLEEAAQAHADEERLQKEKVNLERQWKSRKPTARPLITTNHLAQVVARMAQVPLELILSEERDRLLGLEKRLSEAVLGQTEAVQAVAETVRRARLGLQDARRPQASLLFVGPSGVGKTELARTLAKEIFGREEALVKLDMSEFSEGHSISKLLGSPAGYVGYREGNRLADTIRKHPHSVLLFDEFEKAHADVQHVLLQALEDGKITDATGRPISLRHTYIILTSNVGAEFHHRAPLGFEKNGAGVFSHALIHDALKERFRPELLNRLDRIVVFQPLSREILKRILEREIETLFARLRETQSAAYQISDEVLDWLLAHQKQDEEGARAIRRLVEQEITDLLGKALIEQPQKRKWKIMITKEKLRIG